MLFRQLFDRQTCTYTYLLADEASGDAILIDPVREHLARDTQLLRELGLTLRYCLDTHVHADHVTAGGQLRLSHGCKTVLGSRSGASCADVLADHGDEIRFGRYGLEVRHTPGHTDGCVTYVCHDANMAFTGDTLMIRGCGRTDFQQGDARTLYQSVHEQIFSLPDTTHLYPGHDYKGRTRTTVAEERAHNPRLGGANTVDDFGRIMDNLKLSHPARIAESVPSNLMCGVPGQVEGLSAETPLDTSWGDIQRRADHVPEVTVHWLHAHRDAVEVIDVRHPDEIESGPASVPGSTIVPLAQVAEAATTWGNNKPVVVMCRTGGRSARATAEAIHAGATRVASLRGGAASWNATFGDNT